MREREMIENNEYNTGQWNGTTAGSGGPTGLGLVRHYRKELLLVDLPILVKVEFVNHCLSVLRYVRESGG